MTVTLFPLPTLAPPTVLPSAKAAFSFAVHSFVKHSVPEGKSAEQGVDSGFDIPKTIPTLHTYLVIGCRRKVVVYSWKDGEAEPVKVYLISYCTFLHSFLEH